MRVLVHNPVRGRNYVKVGILLKTWVIILGALLIGIYISYSTKFYYPSLPFSSVSKSEVLQDFKPPSDTVVKVTEENGYEWYIAQADQAKAFKLMKKIVISKGWDYKTQEGSGYFFEKDGETLLVGSQMWTRDYVLFQVKKGWSHQ